MQSNRKNKITLYLIKDRCNEKDFIISYDKYLNDSKTDYLIKEISPNIKLFYTKVYNNSPIWLDSFFKSDTDLKKLYNASIKLILLYKNKEGRFFIVSFGRGKNLIDNDMIENHFGLKVALNLLKQDDLRSIDRVSIGGNQKSSRDQLPKYGNIFDFGADIERDLINKVAGKVSDNGIVKGMISGSDAVTLSSDVDIDNIGSTIDSIFSIYKKDYYKTNFGWIDNIESVKNKKLINELDEKLIESLNSNKGQFWSAVPEIIDWGNVDYFKVVNIKEKQDDIYIDVLLKSFRKELKNAKQLKSKKVKLFDAIGNEPLKTWSAYNCIYGEMDYENNTYCINNGKWYQISKDYRKMIETDFENTDKSEIRFDLFQTQMCKTENDYSTMFVNNHPNDYILMDKNNIYHGGGRNQIELCDILAKDDTLIHLKPYSGSSTLSHFFNQGLVSADLLLSDKEFRDKANNKINASSNDEKFRIDDNKSLRIVYAIIQKDKGGSLPHIPFFSKVSLKYVKSRLKAMRCTVELATIHKVD